MPIDLVELEIFSIIKRKPTAQIGYKNHKQSGVQDMPGKVLSMDLTIRYG